MKKKLEQSNANGEDLIKAWELKFGHSMPEEQRMLYSSDPVEKVVGNVLMTSKLFSKGSIKIDFQKKEKEEIQQ